MAAGSAGLPLAFSEMLVIQSAMSTRMGTASEMVSSIPTLQNPTVDLGSGRRSRVGPPGLPRPLDLTPVEKAGIPSARGDGRMSYRQEPGEPVPDLPSEAEPAVVWSDV